MFQSSLEENEKLVNILAENFRTEGQERFEYIESW